MSPPSPCDATEKALTTHFTSSLGEGYTAGSFSSGVDLTTSTSCSSSEVEEGGNFLALSVKEMDPMSVKRLEDVKEDEVQVKGVSCVSEVCVTGEGEPGDLPHKEEAQQPLHTLEELESNKLVCSLNIH